MNGSRGRRGFLTVLLVGKVYFLIGDLFALPTNHVRAWRLAAWLTGAAVYAAHLGYEHLRLRNSPRSTAFHAATAVALGATGLALAATVHSWLVPSSAPFVRFLLALVVWPVITGLPAFLVVYCALPLLVRLRPRTWPPKVSRSVIHRELASGQSARFRTFSTFPPPAADVDRYFFNRPT